MEARGRLVDGFLCPVCRIETPAPAADITSDQWAERFPTNHVIVTLMDTLSIQQAERQCGPCRQGGTEEVSVGWCKTCKEHMCQACIDYHKSHTRNHKVISTEDVQVETSKAVSPIETCPVHSGKELEFHCADHDVLCCASCAVAKHRKCDKVETIQELAHEIRANKEDTNLIESFRVAIDHAKGLVDYTSQNLQNLPLHKETLINDIKSVREEMNKLLTDLEMSACAALDGLHKETVLQLEDRLATCESLHKAMQSSQALLETVTLHGSDGQVLQTVHRLDKEYNRYKEELKIQHGDTMEIGYQVKVNKQLDTLMQSLTDLGTVTVVRNVAKLADYPGDDLKECPVPVVSPLSERNAEKVLEFNGKLDDDKDNCFFTGVDFTEDGNVLLADLNNNKVKLFSATGQYLDQIKLTSGPVDLTVIDNKTAAVTLLGHDKIQFINLGGKLTKGKKLNVHLDTFTYVDNKLIGTCIPACIPVLSSVKTVSMTGKKINSFNKELERKGDETDDYITAMQGTAGKSRLYLSHCQSNVVSCLTLDGESMFEYSHSDLTYPTGVTTDVEGNMYVCGQKSNNIHQVSPDGSQSRIILDSEKITSPYQICFNKHGDTFVVTAHLNETNDTVHVYRMMDRCVRILTSLCRVISCQSYCVAVNLDGRLSRVSHYLSCVQFQKWIVQM
jgi:hypothetical protein